MPDNNLESIPYKCDTCSEEYSLPEDYSEPCPICGCDTLEPI